MKLLPKLEIDKAKAGDRKKEIDEGLKLARRVDDLRQTVAQEEKALEKFRSETVAKIYAEIDTEGQKLTAVKREVEAAKRQRDELRKPLDDEWEAVHQQSAFLDGEAERLEEAKKVVTGEKSEVDNLLKEARSTLARAQTQESTAKYRVADAVRSNNEAHQTLADAKKIEADALSLKAQIEEELVHKQTEVAVRERNVTMKEQNLTTREKELEAGWKLLEDRRAAFERTIKRANK